MSDLIELRDAMRQFTAERDWEKFHDPKSLLLALVGEVGELAELFQWLPADEVRDMASAEPLKARVGEEMSDVLLYLVRLADVLGLNLGDAAERKLKMNHQKHARPVVAACLTKEGDLTPPRAIRSIQAFGNDTQTPRSSGRRPPDNP